MLNFQEFVEEVVKEGQKLVGDSYRIGQKKVAKTNGVLLTALTIMPDNNAFEGCMYLDYIYENVYCQEGLSVFDITQRLIQAYLKDQFDEKIDIKQVHSWEWVKEHLFCKLINTDMNRELLKETPHREFLDLSVVYYICYSEQRFATSLVKENMMEHWGQTEESLYNQAMHNLRDKGSVVLKDLNAVVQENFDVDMEKDGIMYVLYDSNVPFGTAHILNETTIAMVKEKLGDEFLIIPSSVHELIVLAMDECESCDNVFEVVENVNNTAVLPEERLSYNVYHYHDGKIDVLE